MPNINWKMEILRFKVKCFTNLLNEKISVVIFIYTRVMLLHKCIENLIKNFKKWFSYEYILNIKLTNVEMLKKN